MATFTPRRTRFRYDAIGHDGIPVSGTVRAVNRAQARQRLSVHQLTLTTLDDAPGVLNTEVTTERLNGEHLEGFVAQLAVFTAAGVALPTALEVIGDETDNRLVRRTARDLADRLTAGQTLGDAIDAHHLVIPGHVRGVLRSADTSGDLSSVLSGLHRHLERQAASRRRLMAALLYPAVVATLSVVTMVILAGFALPRYAALFAELDAPAPFVVGVTQTITATVSKWWPLLGALGLLAGGTATWWLRSARTQVQRQHVAWHLPIVGPLLRLSLLERTCRVLALVTASGVALPTALDVAIEVSHHDIMRSRLITARGAIVRGEPVMAALDATGLLTSSARQVLGVGDRTGTLDRQLSVAADLVAGDLDRRVQRATALVEPAMIVAVGLVVAGVAVSLVTTMYGLTTQIST
jgi:type IV pilus assembly protein PilC